MKIHGDIESVNLSTGERYQRVVGDGESRPVQCRGPVDFARLGPQRDVVFGPNESEPTVEEIVRRASQLLDLQRKVFSMHYRNGRPAQNGDRVVSFGNGGGSKIEAVGVLINATAGNDHCNGQIVVNHGWNNGTAFVIGACLCDCLHAEDVESMLKDTGLDKRPAGK